MAGLHSNGLWQGICHRAVSEGTKQSALTVHREIARGPNRRCAHITCEDRILSGKLIQNSCYVLWMQWRSARLVNRKIFETFARILIVIATCVKKGTIEIARETRRQDFQSVLYMPNQAQIDPGSPSYLLTKPVDLNDRCVFWIKLLIGKISSEHEKNFAVHHRVIAGGEAEQPRHPNVIRIVVLDEFLAAQRVHDWRVQPFGQCYELSVRALTASPAQD